MTDAATRELSARRVLQNVALALVATDVALIAMHLLTEASLFDLDVEANLPSWYSSMKLLSVAILSAALAAGEGRRIWALHALLFVGLSADEAASIHETLARSLMELPMLSGLQQQLTGGDSFKNGYTWVWLFAPLIAAVSLFMLLVVLRQLRRRAGSGPAYVGGLGLLLTAVALEARITSFPDVTSWGAAEAARYRTLSTIEECAELLGVSLIFTALASCFESRRQGAR